MAGQAQDVVQGGGVVPDEDERAWVSPSAPEALAAGGLEELFRLVPSRSLRRIPGRETCLVSVDRRVLVVKRFLRGERRDGWFDGLRGVRRSPARREAENLRALRAAGFPVPAPLGWWEELGARSASGRGRSALAMELLEGAEPLGDRLRLGAARERATLSRAVATLVARLHAAGWYHRDLYAHQILVRAGEPWLIDLGRARHQRAPRARWWVKDLAALAHSAPDEVGRAERLRFLRHYLAARGLDAGRATRRAWTRRVEAKRRRIARHRPRWSDVGDPR